MSLTIEEVEQKIVDWGVATSFVAPILTGTLTPIQSVFLNATALTAFGALKNINNRTLKWILPIGVSTLLLHSLFEIEHSIDKTFLLYLSGTILLYKIYGQRLQVAKILQEGTNFSILGRYVIKISPPN